MHDDDSTVEEWRQIPGWEGLYSVSNLGRVRSHYWSPPRPLRPATEVGGRRIVCLVVTVCGHQTRKMERVHTLVMLAFVGPRPAGMECLHGDGNPSNNRLKNLRWGTSAENTNGLRKHGTLCRGVNVGTSKLSESDVREIRELLSIGRTQRNIARVFGISSSMVSKIRLRKAWGWLG